MSTETVQYLNISCAKLGHTTDYIMMYSHILRVLRGRRKKLVK